MRRVDFNQDWKVWKEENAFELMFRVAENAVETDLPYDAMFHERQREDSVNKGKTGHLDGGVYKYYKRFFVPAECRKKNVMLQFEGVYMNSFVYINQSLAGSCAYGYTDFFVNANDYLKYGEENEILVLCKCGAAPNSRWYSGGGIYRPVYWHEAGKVFLPPYSLRFSTVELSGEGACVQAEAEIENTDICAHEFDAVLSISTQEGERVFSASYPLRSKGRSRTSFRRRIFLENVRPWSEEDPFLYTVELKLVQEGEILDEDCVRTGIRSLSLDVRRGLRVNGKSVKLRGACIHHDTGLLGAATYEDYEYRRVRLLKEAGFNAVRSAHNPASQALLNACDALGVYVMDELTDVWTKNKTDYDYSMVFERDWEKDVEAMVQAAFNHPSVILYSTGNEIFEVNTDKGLEISRSLGDKIHQLDSTRFTTNGINGAFAAGPGLARIVRDITGTDPGSGDVNIFMAAMGSHMAEIVTHPVVTGILEKLETTMDILGYNYMTERYRGDAEAYPQRLMVGSETYPKQIGENWKIIEETPAVLGDFTWTGWDYMGEVSDEYPSLVNTGGDLSLIGSRRPVSYYREIVFGLKKGPCVAVQDPARYGISRNFGPWCFTDATFNYRYPGQEGKPVRIEVYAGGDEVELYQNGRLLGRKPCGRSTDYCAVFDGVYEPGELLAVAFENGSEVGRFSLRTAKEAAEISVKTEMGRGRDGKRLAFLDITLVDEDGLVAQDADNRLWIKTEGPVKLLGFGSVHAGHDRGFESCETTAFQGRALAILQITGEEPVTCRIGGQGLKESYVFW